MSILVKEWLTNNGWQPYDDNPYFRLFNTQDARIFCQICGESALPILGGMTFRTGGGYICQGTGVGWDTEPLPGEDLNSFVARTVDESEEFLTWFESTPGASKQWVEVVTASNTFIAERFQRDASSLLNSEHKINNS